MHMRRPSAAIFLLFAGGCSMSAQEAVRRVIPIPQQPLAQPVPDYIGAPAVPQTILARPVPQSPFMAPNGRSGVHLDAYQSDTYPTAGPLGHPAEVTSTFVAAICGTVTFDKQGRIITVCASSNRITAYLMDPVTLQNLSSFDLPATAGNGDFGGGGYFFLDNLDRAVVPTRGNDIWRLKEVNTTAGTRLVKDHTCANDLPAMIPSDQEILSTIPDANGLLWFTTSGSNTDPTGEPAMVGTIIPDPSKINSCTVKLHTLPSGELIFKSFGVDPDPSSGGVFIVSDHQLYRFDAASDGTPTVTWHEAYDRGIRIKPGQTEQGSGTTPTLMGKQFVTIADNADPLMHVLVYRRAAHTDKQRLVCAEPVFRPGRSATFNSLIATNRSISIENNYGFRSPLSTVFGGTTEPGIARIDLDEGGNGCYTLWETYQESVPNVVSQASLVTGLEYTYSKDPSPADAPFTDAWYFTAVDFNTGETVFKILAGTGILYNSYYSSVYLGPDGKTAYVGVLGGLVRIHKTY